MLDDWAKYQLQLNRIPEEEVTEMSTDMVITLKDGTRRRICEVFSRCMGYFRRTVDFNVGKRSEFEERKPFSEEKAKMYLVQNNGETPDDAA